MAPPDIVLDTNVLYAALRSNSGASFAILDGIQERKIRPLLSQTVLTEYEEILKLHAHTLNLTFLEIDTVLDFLCAVCRKAEMRTSWVPILTDPDDEAFVKLAVAVQADAIVTHNLKDFAPALAIGIKVLAPKVFLETIRV